MVEVGESTGALPDMLNSLADFYDEEIETSLDRFVDPDPADPADRHGRRHRRAAAVAVHAAVQSVERAAIGCRTRDCKRHRPMNGNTPAAINGETDAALYVGGCRSRRPITRQKPRVARRLAERYQLEFVDLEHFHIDHELFRAIPADLMLRYGFVPYRREGTTLVIVVSDPTDLQMIDELAVQLATPIRVSRRHAVGDPVDPQEERELAARARGSHRKLPDADSARGRRRRREPDGRQADVGRQPGHPARRLDGLHRDPAARQRHPHRDAGRRGAREVPHRRRAAAGDAADRQALPQHDHLAHQGHGGARHRREARAAGRPLQAAGAGQDDRLPRLDHAERARRGRRHPHPRQGIDQRAVPRAAPRHPRLPRRASCSGSGSTSPSRTAWCS